MLMLIWRNIARRRAQSALTVTITMLTVFMFVLVLAAFLLTRQGLALSRERMGADAMLVPRYAVADADDLLFTAVPENSYMPAEVLEDAKKLKGIAALSPQFYAQSLSLSCCDVGEEARIIGFDPETDFTVSPYIIDEAGKQLQDNEIIMGWNYEDEQLLGLNYLLLGTKCKVVSLLEPTGTGMDGTIFLTINNVRQLCLDSLVLSEDWKDKDPFDYLSVIMLKLEDGVDPAEFAEYVKNSGIDARCILTGETIASLQNQMDSLMKIIFALWLTSLFIAGLALLGRFNAIAKERKKEIGLLRALGFKKANVFGLIIGETSLLALIGGVIGSLLALACIGPVVDFLKDSFRMSPSAWSSTLAWLCVGAGILLSLVLGVLAAISPAAKSASLDPQQAISRGELG